MTSFQSIFTLMDNVRILMTICNISFSVQNIFYCSIFFSDFLIAFTVKMKHYTNGLILY